MIEIRVHLIATNGFPSHNFKSQAFLGNGQSRESAYPRLWPFWHGPMEGNTGPSFPHAANGPAALRYRYRYSIPAYC